MTTLTHIRAALSADTYEQPREQLGAKEQTMEKDVQCCGESTLPTCCEEHSARYAMLLSLHYADDYKRFLLAHEPHSGWRDERQATLAFAVERERSA